MGTLFIVATPIGNLSDITHRALQTLREADVIACEDTRHTVKLLNHFGIQKPMVSYHEFNEEEKAEELARQLSGTTTIALVSDAGTPAINDPGYELVRAALASNFDVVPIPGPSAPIAALSISGLPTDSFLYLGYLPHKKNDRRKFIERVSDFPHTLIFLESPYRIVEGLEDLLSLLGDRRACIAREMTKMFEEYWRGTLSGAVEYFKSQPARGEFTLVVDGKSKEDKMKWTEEEMLEAIKQELKKHRSAKEISAELAKQSGWSKKDIYARVNQI